MTTDDGQIELRNAIIALCHDYIDKDLRNIIPAYVACIGAAAVCAAVLPPDARETLIAESEGAMLASANKRADEMRSGALDRTLVGH